MVIYILFAIPVLVAIAALFVDYAVFITNLAVIPLIVALLVLSARSAFAPIFSLLVIVSFVFYVFSADFINTLYLLFELSAMCVMLKYPGFFFSKINVSHLLFVRYVSLVFVAMYFLMALSRDYWFGDRYLGPLRNTNLSAYFLMLSIAFLATCVPIRSRKILAVCGVSILAIFVAYLLSGSRSVFFFLPIYFYFIVKSGCLKNTYWLIGILPVFILVSGSDVVLLGGERFDSEETSFVTRAAVTEALTDELFDAKGLPQGPRYTTRFVVELTGNPEMHAHNDLISGVIDYGFLFFAFIFYFFYLLFSRFSLHFWFSFLIVLAYMSSALHGYFFGCMLFTMLLAVMKRYVISNSN